MRVCANYSHGSSNYKFALSQYELAYRQLPDDYLLCLCISIDYLNMACQLKQSCNKNTLVTQVQAVYLASFPGRSVAWERGYRAHASPVLTSVRVRVRVSMY